MGWEVKSLFLQEDGMVKHEEKQRYAWTVPMGAPLLSLHPAHTPISSVGQQWLQADHSCILSK